MTFLLGAGFNADAKEAAGLILGIHGQQIDCQYPLTSDLLKACFQKDSLPPGTSIEELFGESLTRNDFSPIQKMTEMLMEADYYIASALFPREGAGRNVYSVFFER